MEIVSSILILLLCVALSSAAAKIAPFRLPLPLVQIGIGILLSLPLFGADSNAAIIKLDFDPEVFMLLFIPPLLFADGWHIPKKAFFQQQPLILAMALGLVVVNVLILGAVIHLLIKDIPYGAGFALAAVLAPTDAVAVSGIFGERYVPKNLMNLLQGEALINDASGLIALNFAYKATIAAVLIAAGVQNHALSTFSLWAIPQNFLISAIGGIIIGLLVNLIYNLILQKLTQMGGEDITTQTLLLLILPFAAFILARYLGVSGVLAVVAAGIAQSYNDTSINRQLTSRLHSRSIWHTLEQSFNGIVFILLGLQFAHIIDHTSAVQAAGRFSIDSTSAAFTYVVLIGTAMLAIRFGWVLLLEKITVYQAKRKNKKPYFQGIRSIAIITFAGVRGTISLAAALSIPIIITGTNLTFPQHNVIVFLAASIILFTIICAVIGLPLLMIGLKQNEEETLQELEEQTEILRQCILNALEAIETTYQQLINSPDYQDDQEILDLAYANTRRYYENRLIIIETDHDLYQHKQQSLLTENILFLKGLHAERHTLQQLKHSRMIDEEMFTEKMHKLDLLEASVQSLQNHHFL